MVDSKSGALTDRILAEVKKLSPSGKPVRYLLNTSADADHVGGNESLAKVARVRGQLDDHQHAGRLAERGADHRARQRAGRVSSLPDDGVADRDVRRPREGDLLQRRAGADVSHPAAHTDGDSLVFFRQSDVVATGDIYRTDSYPVIDLQKGGSVQGVIDGLNRVLDLAVPAHHEEGGTFIVPGHGRISDEFDVLEYRDMVTIVRDRDAGDEEEGDDARAGEGRAADARLRPALRRGHRRLDDRHVRRGGVQEPEADELSLAGRIGDPDTVLVVDVRLDEPPIAVSLDDDEQRRAERFVFDKDRLR